MTINASAFKKHLWSIVWIKFSIATFYRGWTDNDSFTDDIKTNGGTLNVCLHRKPKPTSTTLKLMRLTSRPKFITFETATRTMAYLSGIRASPKLIRTQNPAVTLSIMFSMTSAKLRWVLISCSLFYLSFYSSLQKRVRCFVFDCLNGSYPSHLETTSDDYIITR